MGRPSIPASEPQVAEPFVNSVQNEEQQEKAKGAGANTGAGIARPKTEAELEADRLYEEAMEDEYAKREGGA